MLYMLGQSAANGAAGAFGGGFAPAEWIAVLAIGGSMVLVFTGIVAGVIRRVAKTKALEESRRELAAYVAEGSMSPQDAERLLDAGMPRWERPSRN